jgi:hypothetical protein
LFTRRYALYLTGSLASVFLGGAASQFQSLSGKAVQIQMQLASATSLEEIVRIANDWKQTFDAQIKLMNPSREQSDREQMESSIVDALKEKGIEEFLKENIAPLYFLWNLFSIPTFLGPLLMVVKASSPSQTVSSFTECAQLDDIVQNDIRKAASKYLPVDWQDSLVRKLLDENPALQAELSSGLP